jgi:hypothetical protein
MQYSFRCTTTESWPVGRGFREISDHRQPKAGNVQPIIENGQNSARIEFYFVMN